MPLYDQASWHLLIVYMISSLSVLLPRASRCVEAALLIPQLYCQHFSCIQADFSFLNDALNQSIVTQERVDAALRRMLVQRIRLGDFDPPERLPWANISMVSLVAAGSKGSALRLPAASCLLQAACCPSDSASGWATLTLESNFPGPKLVSASA